VLIAWIVRAAFERLVRRASLRRRLANVALEILGAAWMVLGSAWLVREESFRARAVPTVGTVVALGPLARLGSTSRKEIVEYVDAAGDVRRFTDRGPEVGVHHAPGARVDVLHDPSDPSEARIADRSRAWLPAAYLFVGGMICLSFALLVPPEPEEFEEPREGREEAADADASPPRSGIH